MQKTLQDIGIRIWTTLERHPRSTGLITGIILTVCAVLLIQLSQTVAHVRDVTLPMLAQVPELNRRVHTVESQIDIAHMTASDRLPIHEENLAVYILPSKTDSTRVVQIFDALSSTLEQQNLGEIDSIVLSDGIIELKGTLHDEGIDHILDLLDTAGRLSVADTLSQKQIHTLLQRIERSNPLSIVALEKLFSIDLLNFALSQRAAEDALLRSLGKEEGEAIMHTLLQQETLMRSVALLQGPTGKSLAHNNLWPMPLLSLGSIEREFGGKEGWYRVKMMIETHTR